VRVGVEAAVFAASDMSGSYMVRSTEFISIEVSG
jgi:hypothetical protein